MNAERLDEVEKWGLKHGSHADVEKGLCVMEAVAYVAGEPHSDHPKCACPRLTAFAIRINDRVDDDTRQKLKPLIPKLVGTRAGFDTEKKRSRFMAHRTITVTLPLLIDAIQLPEVSARLRACGDSNEDLRSIGIYLREQKEAIRKAAYAAAAAADAAAAYAAAAYAADAAAAYAAAAYAAAYAAAAYAAAYAAAAPSKAKWLKVRADINDSAIETLRLACEITS
jgi:hypothetical protein